MKAFHSIERNWVDFLLALISAAMATYSMGMGLSNPTLGFIFGGGMIAGTFIAYALFRLAGEAKWFNTASIVLYTIFAIASPILSAKLNSGLPGGGFPRELILSAGSLSWMLMLCSFVSWRDQTLLFQSVPCIALFGLVGAFNTFDGATITFFVFMLSIALLYARCHRRVMLERAVRSGFQHIGTIRNGPWKSMAGPEWGLASAGLVIVLSVISAPLLQLSMSQVSGVVNIKPPTMPPQVPQPFSAAVTFGDSSSIGQGPRDNVSEREMFRVQFDEARYLRVSAYNEYSKGVWRRVPNTNGLRVREGTADNTAFPQIYLDEREQNFEIKEFRIKFSGRSMNKFPAPIIFDSMREAGWVAANSQGGFDLIQVPRKEQPLVGYYHRLKDTFQPTTSPRVATAINLYTAISSVSPKVVEWAKEVAKGGKSDYDKALLLKRAIEGRSKYNLNAEAGPPDVDPVENFLFGEKKEGYCDLFASSMVQMARAAGLPARYVVGYYPASMETDAQGYYVIREADAHAWAEIYFNGGGWIPFDATEGAEQVPGGERGSARDKIPFMETEAFYYGIRILVGAFIIVGCALLIKSWNQPIKPEHLVLRRITDTYFEFTGAIELASGFEKIAAETPQEFLTRTEGFLGELRNQASELTALFVPMLFGPTLPHEEASKNLKSQVSEFGKRAKEYAKAQRGKA